MVVKLWSKVTMNGELIDLEKAGFERGEKRGKTMNCDWIVLSRALKKQMADLQYALDIGLIEAPSEGLTNLAEIKRCIADVRNVAGCLFLKIQEEEKEASSK